MIAYQNKDGNIHSSIKLQKRDIWKMKVEKGKAKRKQKIMKPLNTFLKVYIYVFCSLNDRQTKTYLE